MPTNAQTKRMLTAYLQRAIEPMGYFSGMFDSPARNFHNSERVTLDIVRGGESVAIVIQDLSTGPRMNATDIYTNKEFLPPIFDEAIALNSWDLLKRMPGDNPFDDPVFKAAVIERMFAGMATIEAKIRRAIELMCSQVMQTGTITFVDAAGDTLFTLSFSPKATHFPTAAVSWASATLVQKLANLEALGEAVRSDGRSSPNRMTFGSTAWDNLLATTGFRDRYDARRLDQGTIVSEEPRGAGQRYRGIIDLGNYRYDVWTYNGRYDLPGSGVSTPFMHPGKVIVEAEGGRKDLTFGAVPNIGQITGAMKQLLPELPTRFANSAGGMDMFTNVWITPDGKQMFGGVGARPLAIPTAIDAFGCLNTQLT